MSNKTLATSPASLSDKALRDVLIAFQSSLVDRVLNIAGLAIGTSANTKVKIVNATHAFVNKTLLVIAAATEVALSGTTANGKFAIYVLTVDSAGSITATKSDDADSRAEIVFPTLPTDEAMIGFVLINPTGTGDFVGGTTPLGDATVVPNAEYVDAINGFNAGLAAV